MLYKGGGAPYQHEYGLGSSLAGGTQLNKHILYIMLYLNIRLVELKQHIEPLARAA